MAGIPDHLHFTTRLADSLKEALGQAGFSQLFVLADTHTTRHCLPVVQEALPDHRLITIPPGEKYKTLDTCRQIWQALTDARADRQALLLNLGGGVICDMGGFCARTYKRGIAFWNLPTTLLAQVDASAGGKLGIDFNGFKNHLGLFSEPDQVWLDPVFFATLPAKEMLSGYAEMIKHGLIADAGHFASLAARPWNETDWPEMIPRSVAIKQQIVVQDPAEKGLRQLLNFGHTLGHAIESYCLNHGLAITHGQAVAAGMVGETWLSAEKGLLARPERDRIIDFLITTFPPVPLAEPATDEITALALQDKKNTGHTIQCVLLETPGQAVTGQPVSRQDLARALAYYLQAIKPAR